MRIRSWGAIFAPVFLTALIGAVPVHAGDASYLSQITSDFKFTVNNAEADTADTLTAPLHFDIRSLERPGVAFTLLGAGAALGGAFALDNTLRSHIRGMSNGAANDLEQAGTISLGAGAGLIYLYGLQTDDDKARQDMITTVGGVGLGTAITYAFKYGWGRARPRQGHGSTAFFRHGESFVSGETTPVFALACGISEYFDNHWWVMLPAYSAAVAVGLGRMGHDAHWFSDVVGSGLIGVATTELLFYLHRRHADDPNGLKVFPVAAPNGAGGGVGLGYDW